MNKFKKSRVNFKPPVRVDGRLRLGEVECNVTKRGGLWYIGEPRKYACIVYAGIDDENEDDLRIFVVPKGYNPNKVGLIYTDGGFIKDIKEFFKRLGMPAWSRVDYSEQGMQGDNYVDMEVFSKRAVKWIKERR